MPKWDFKQDVDYRNINKKAVEDNDLLFYILTIASFIEITSETYADNLSNYYDDNGEIVSWLQNEWEQEEVQHGQALKKYIEAVWPGFDWESAYKRFLELYLPLCKLEAFQPTKALEMLARMIVETGTSTFYRSIEKYASALNEPTLEKLAHYIYKDEIHHYSYFDKFFKYYNVTEKNSRKKVLKIIAKRLKEANSEDIEMAFKAVSENMDNNGFHSKTYDEFLKEINHMASENYPYNMAIKMMIHPLDINKVLEASMVPVLRSTLKIIGI